MKDKILSYSMKEYKKILLDYINNVPFSPFHIKKLDKKLNENEWQIYYRTEFNQLLDISKHKNEYGFRINHFESGKLKIFHNIEIHFDTLEDYLSFLNLHDDFNQIKNNYRLFQEYLPELEITEDSLDVLAISEENFKTILKYLKYFREHPAPLLHSRELPIEGDTKFYENNRKIFQTFHKHFHTPLPDLLDSFEPLVRFKLHPNRKISIYTHSIHDLSIPLTDFSEVLFPEENIFIIENKLTYLQFPLPENSIAIHGEGYFSKKLNNAKNLINKNIYYFGDLDIDGLRILSEIRAIFPNTKSFLMNKEIFLKYKDFTVKDKTKNFFIPETLNECEKELFEHLNHSEKNRLEQEKIPISEISTWLQTKKF